ncbi:MAG: molybdopterin-dependent oxidoreductase [Eggerthellaceae bacterium]|nr:molybdopterin-dependent oxidoreductase [Eggerthellaceae bacterium]
MSGTNSPQGGLTRRGFLKTTAAVAGASALAGGAGLTALADDSSEAVVEEQTFRSACRGNCGSRCPMTLTVREGKIVRAAAMSEEDYGEADAHRRRFCVKGYSQPQRVYDPDRLKYPMRRVGGTERGAGQWERITWDEAFQEIGTKIGAAVAEYGGSSIGVWSSYGSYGVLNGAMGGFMSVAYGRFCTALGANIMGAGADTAQSHVQSSLLGNSGNDFVDARNAKTIVAWGGNPAEAYVHAWQFVCDAREAGARLITVDPQFTASAMHSDVYIPVLPGTDGAMMLAMINYIHANGLMDVAYMKGNTVSPFLVKEDGTYLRGSDAGIAPAEGPLDAYGRPTFVDPVMVWDESQGKAVVLDEAVDPAIEGSYEVEGVKVSTVFTTCLSKMGEYTIERAAEICQVPAEQIVSLANAYATEGPVYTMTFQGIGHHVNSHHNYKNLAMLHAVTGNAGKPGASICGAPSTGLVGYNMMAYMMGAPGNRFCGMHLPEIMNTGKWAGQDLTMRVLWICNGNVLSCESGRIELIEAVKKVDYVIVADVNMNDSAQWADIVLPIPHASEVQDFDPVCSAPYPTYTQKVVEPQFECKTDMDIMRGIAPYLGLEMMFAQTDEEYLASVIDTEANVAGGLSYEALKDGSLIRQPGYTEDRHVVVYGTAESSRLKYYIENPAPRNNWGQAVADYERYPYYEHANESYSENPLREKYPLFGCSEHNKYHVHSQLAYTPVMRELEPVPFIKINAADAAERGIAQGDLVRAYNDRGSCVIKAVVTEGIKPGVICIPHGFQADQFVEGHAQDLTSVVMSDFCSNSAFYDFLCEVEKYEGGVA